MEPKPSSHIRSRSSTSYRLYSQTLSQNWFFKEADTRWFPDIRSTTTTTTTGNDGNVNHLSRTRRKSRTSSDTDENDDETGKIQNQQPDLKAQQKISNWLPVKSIPSTVHTDLLHHDIIPDPFIGFNESKVEWVGERRWVYRTTFSLPDFPVSTATNQGEPQNRTGKTINRMRMKTKAALVFDGLDTFATVKIDGVEVLRADNMFRRWRVDVSHLLDQDRNRDFGQDGCVGEESLVPDDVDEDDYVNVTADDNGGVKDDDFEGFTSQARPAYRPKKQHELEIVFEPALFKARAVKNSYPEHKWICFNGEPARLAARKAQYHWGWDWGPFLMCAGIWRDVRLEVYHARISDVRTDVTFGADLSDVTVHVSYETEGWSDEDGKNTSADPKQQCVDRLHARVMISNLDDSPLERTRFLRVFKDGKKDVKVKLDHPDLWWPADYGEQSMYEVQVSIFSADFILLDTVTKRIGLRKLELIQKPDKHGKSFYFRVNDVDIFCGGSCWIPADSMLTNVTQKRYREWIELMVPANQKMIRIWGGGIYEDDAFYDACDELGILVWQDFMFACGNYPTFPGMLESIGEEAVDNVRRIRHHPCLALLAGNNEDYQVQEQSGLTYDHADKDEKNWLKTDFPARYIYESLLPKVVSAECPLIPYHPGSPWGDGKATSDPTVGDLHQWNVWHGSQEKYQIFDSLGGRFNSEFGMEAFPHIETIKAFVENDADLHPQSRVIDFHNKASGHERRIATYVVENVRSVTDLEGYIHLTQLIQCEALMYGYRGWRKQWGEGRKCGGALVWQLNDCWPVTSWSICDYYLRRKPSYYAIARVLAPIAIGIRRDHHDWSESHAKEPNTQQWEMWAVSSSIKVVEVSVELRFISVKTGKEIKHPISLKSVMLAPNGTTKLAWGIIDNLSQEPHVLAAQIRVNGKVISRDADWPQPLKYLEFPDRQPQVKFVGDQIHVSAQRPVKCLVFEEREGVLLSDSALDVMPGDAQTLTAKGLKGSDKPLRWTYLGAGEQ